MSNAKTDAAEPRWERLPADPGPGEEAGPARALLRVARNVAAANAHEAGSLELAGSRAGGVDLDAIAAFLDADVDGALRRVAREGEADAAAQTPHGMARPRLVVDASLDGDGTLRVLVGPGPRPSADDDGAPAGDDRARFPDAVEVARLAGCGGAFGDKPHEPRGARPFRRRCRDDLASDASALIVAGWRRILRLLARDHDLEVGDRPVAVPRDGTTVEDGGEPVLRLRILDEATELAQAAERSRVGRTSRLAAAWATTDIRTLARRLLALVDEPDADGATAEMGRLLRAAGIDVGGEAERERIAADVMIRTLDRIDRRWRTPRSRNRTGPAGSTDGNGAEGANADDEVGATDAGTAASTDEASRPATGRDAGPPVVDRGADEPEEREVGSGIEASDVGTASDESPETGAPVAARRWTPTLPDDGDDEGDDAATPAPAAGDAVDEIPPVLPARSAVHAEVPSEAPADLGGAVAEARDGVAPGGEPEAGPTGRETPPVTGGDPSGSQPITASVPVDPTGSQPDPVASVEASGSRPVTRPDPVEDAPDPVETPEVVPGLVPEVEPVPESTGERPPTASASPAPEPRETPSRPSPATNGQGRVPTTGRVLQDVRRPAPPRGNAGRAPHPGHLPHARRPAPPPAPPEAAVPTPGVGTGLDPYAGLRRYQPRTEDLFSNGIASVDDLVERVNEMKGRLGEPPVGRDEFPSKRSQFDRLVSELQEREANLGAGAL